MLSTFHLHERTRYKYEKHLVLVTRPARLGITPSLRAYLVLGLHPAASESDHASPPCAPSPMSPPTAPTARLIGPLTCPQARLALLGTEQVCGRSFLSPEAIGFEGRQICSFTHCSIPSVSSLASTLSSCHAFGFHHPFLYHAASFCTPQPSNRPVVLLVFLDR